MEKYSAYRDPGTGIQPFLTPVPPAETNLVANATLPLQYILAVVRTTLVLAIALVYSMLRLLFMIFYLVSPIYRVLDDFITFVFGRITLLIVGVAWISVELVTRKRSRGAKLAENWKPKGGDIIVSNWVSWLEILWLAHKFNPIFVIPIPESMPESLVQQQATPIIHAPRRRPGFPQSTTSTRIPIRGFRQVSFLELICMTGLVPPFGGPIPKDVLPLEVLRQRASRPLVIFPECTSSNGRGVLRFANVFQQNVPVKNYQVFVMNVRYDPPKATAPTLSHSLPSAVLNPLSHLFLISSSVVPAQITIKLLSPSESPGSPLFMASEILSDYMGDDQLSEACAILIAQMGKVKRVGMGWEDKSLFLAFYKSKEHE